MKYLKSSFHNLHQVFERSISVRYIAEPFVSFDIQRHSADVLAFMKDKDFDVVGVRDNGSLIGYVNQADLLDGTLEQYKRSFDERLLIEDWNPLLAVLKLLEESPQVFILVMGEVWGIVTKGDLQKAPVRMWLFGILSMLEMQLLRLIRAEYPQDEWKKFITNNRLNKAEQLLQERKRRNEAIDLADCLQFCDKKNIVINCDTLRCALGFPSKKMGEKLLKTLESLRNELAHAQDIITGRWPELVTIATEAKNLLVACETCEIGAKG